MRTEFLTTNKFGRFILNFGVPFIKRTFDLRITLYNTPKEYVIGYTSRTRDGKHVLFMDYDNVDLDDIADEVKYLQMKYRLPDFYLFKSPDKADSFHAFCPSTHTLFEAFNIIKDSSCDLAFKSSPIAFKGRAWVLRISGKGKRQPPEFLEIIDSPFDEYVVSKAHLDFIQKIFKVPLRQYRVDDGINQVPIIRYNTANRV